MRDIMYEVGSVTGLFLLLLGVYHILQGSLLAFDAFASLALLVVLWHLRKKLHQDQKSFLAICLVLILHNMNLYPYTFLMRFDHYMHFAGGFAIALFADRLLRERLSLSKRVFMMVTIALGVGAFGEILEWLGYSFLWYGQGFFRYGVGDFGEYNNAVTDMMFNLMGAAVMGLIAVMRK